MIHNRPFNVGRTGENYQIRQIAEFVEQAVPGSKIEYAADGEKDGFVQEELGEVLHAQGETDAARPHFARAHALLSEIPWVAEDTARLERLAELARP